MAFGIFLNFEKLSTQIIEDEIAKMTDDNVLQYDDGINAINEEKFLENLYRGCIVATFIVNLYETALNTIVGKRLGCTEPEILKTSHGVKLQLICTMCNIDLASIKGNHNYAVVQSIIKLRNDITHYKNNQLYEGTFIPSDIKLPSGTSKEEISSVFTKSYMDKCYKATISLLELICTKCGLVLYKDCQVIDCNGRDGLCEFIVSQETFDDGDRNK